MYHALNRAVARLPLFEKPADYEAFERILDLAMAKHPTRLLGYCLMPNHWHLVLWPRKEGELSEFLRWLTHTHSMRWHAHHKTTGSGHIYQGRFKAFPVETDDHLLTVLRYVERNALRANLVKRAQDWRWSSLWVREQAEHPLSALLSDWPVPRPAEWLQHVNKAQTNAEVEAIRRAVARGMPFGSEGWTQKIARRLGLESTLRPRGRPKKGQ